MKCCHPSACSLAPLVAGGWIASEQITRLSWAMWVWIAILLVVVAVSMFTVSPASPDQDTGEPPP